MTATPAELELVDPSRPLLWASMTRMTLLEAGYPDVVVETSPGGCIVVESCGDCSCPDDGRPDCGPPAKIAHRALALTMLAVELGREPVRR